MTNLFNNLSPAAVCERIKRTRLARDVSQVVLARRVGVTQSAIANWESRQEFLPEVGQASKLADALGVDLEWIYRGKSDRLPADLLQKIIEGPPPIRKRRKKRTS